MTTIEAYRYRPRHAISTGYVRRGLAFVARWAPRKGTARKPRHANDNEARWYTILATVLMPLVVAWDWFRPSTKEDVHPVKGIVQGTIIISAVLVTYLWMLS